MPQRGKDITSELTKQQLEFIKWQPFENELTLEDIRNAVEDVVEFAEKVLEIELTKDQKEVLLTKDLKFSLYPRRKTA